MAYTPMEDTANTHNILILISAITCPSSKGITTQPNIAKVKDTIGANINSPTLERVGNIVSLEKSFTPSAIG